MITIEARRLGDGGVRVRFVNQGDPIPEPKLKVIFEKFYRLDAARATNRGGAGLGLPSPRRLYARMAVPSRANRRPSIPSLPSSCPLRSVGALTNT